MWIKYSNVVMYKKSVPCHGNWHGMKMDWG